MDPFKAAQGLANQIRENAQNAVSNLPEDPIQQISEQAQQVVQTGLAATTDTIETVHDKAAGVFDQVATAAAAIESPPWIAEAKHQLHDNFTKLIGQEIDRFLANIDPGIAGALREHLTPEAFLSREPDWKELDQIHGWTQQLPSHEIPKPPGILWDKEDKAHDGESQVIWTTKDENNNTVRHHGHIVEENGQKYVVEDDENGQPKTDANGNVIKEPLEDEVYYTNGMITNKAKADNEAATISETSGGRKVVVTYNARQGFGPDLKQSIQDKFDPFGIVHENPATDTNADLMYEAAKSGEEKDFVCHSQGGIIMRNALMRAHARLYCEKFAETWNETHDPVKSHLAASKYADEKIKNVHIVSAGAAAWAWPPYANADHVVNTNDPVPMLFGQNAFVVDPREAIRETFGYDVKWLPENEHVDVVNEPLSKTNWIGHSYRKNYSRSVEENL